MNIIIIPSWYPKNAKDPVGSFFREQAIALAKNTTHNIIVVAFEGYGIRTLIKGKKPQKADYIDNGVRTIRQPILENSNTFSKLGLNIRKKVVSKLLRQLDVSQGVVFHAHSAINEGYFACFYSKYFKIPLIITEHHTMFIENSASKNALIKFQHCVKNCKKMLFVSSQFKKKMELIFGKINNSVIIHNPVNCSIITPKTHNENGNFNFLCVGGLQQRKGMQFLIDAFTQSFKFIKTIQLQIIGDGIMKQALTDKIDALQMTDQIHLLGTVDREAMPLHYANANAFALVSECESFGVVYIEALSAGIPAIGTKGEGDEDIINSDCGILTEYGNVEEIAKALKYIYDNYSHYDSSKIRAYCENKFSERVYVEKMIRFYEELI